jgi:hypothetical protein
MKFLKSVGFTQGRSDHTLFIKKSGGGKITVLIVYVDDIILTGNDAKEATWVKSKLSSEFEIKDLGPLRHFLGMEVARSLEGLIMTQRKYTLDLLKETGLEGCRPAWTPMECNLKLGSVKGKPVNVEGYQRLVGKLIYLAHTRPDVSYAVGTLSQFMHSPNEFHLEAAKRLLRYLKTAPGRGLYFKKSSRREVSIFTDADWGGYTKDRRSITGYCTYVWGNLVTWRSKKQDVVARSSAEAEFRSMAQGICEGMWIKKVMEDLGADFSQPIKLLCDNKAAIEIANEPVQHDRTKHVEIDRHFIKEKLESGLLCVLFLPSSRQIADGLTKALGRAGFDEFVGKLGLSNIFAPT